jgi:hypothetical protein
LSISSTVLVFLVIPVGVVVLVASLVFASGARSRRDRRYRPGRPYDFQPIWFLAQPDQVNPALAHPDAAHPALAGSGHQAPALQAPYIEDSSGARVRPGPVGGASDSW